MHKILKSYFGLIKKFIPDKPKGSSVGIDIGLNEVRAVEITKEGGVYQMIWGGIEKVDKFDIKDALTKTIKSLKDPKASIYTSIFGKGTLIRHIDFPRMTPADLKNSFALELDKYFPFPAEQIYSDCYILDPQGKGKQMSVLASAATREHVDNRIKLFKEAGVNIDYITLNQIALINSFNRFPPEDIEQNYLYALLDVGENVTSIAVLSGGLPRFSRDIFIGSQDLIKRIANALGKGITEAAELISAASIKGEDLEQACESAILGLVQEIKLSLDYFTTEKNNEVAQIFLTGPGAQIGILEGYLEKSLDLKVKRWNPFKSIDTNAVKELGLDKHFIKLGTALGLAAYDYD
ncbi:MAG: pilus assembly protein PilM [Candidatus Omnitrophica bacterium]|nr:pilus assembly protein PilM [Candidatus Omnitrophota bacterium]